MGIFSFSNQISNELCSPSDISGILNDSRGRCFLRIIRNFTQLFSCKILLFCRGDLQAHLTRSTRSPKNTVVFTCLYEQFLLFPQCFLPFWRPLRHFLFQN